MPNQTQKRRINPKTGDYFDPSSRTARYPGTWLDDPTAWTRAKHAKAKLEEAKAKGDKPEKSTKTGRLSSVGQTGFAKYRRTKDKSGVKFSPKQYKRLGKLRASAASARQQDRRKLEREKDRLTTKAVISEPDLLVQQHISMVKSELAARELTRRNLLFFIQRFNPSYTAGWVHEDICMRLQRFMQAMERGETPRLMLFMPPRHGKSMIASQYFPAWLLGMHPEWEIIAASYSLSLPLDFSRRVRALIRDKTYRNVFSNTALDPDKQNAEGWNTTRGGGYVPAGVGGSITGRGAHCLIIDDPFKDAEEADSETIREKVWDWFGSTAYTRLAPNGGVLIIQTRWHDDDLSGRLINHMTEALKEAKETPEVEAHIDKWEIVSYPAIATANEAHRKKGEALHPQRFPIGRLYKIKRTLQPRHWSALYQQNPVPDEGVYFRKEMMRFETLPDWRTLPVGIAFDLAIGKKQTNDYTVGAVGCIDSSDRLYVLEVVRARWDTYEIVEAMLDLYERYSSKGATPLIGIERGQLELAIRPHLKKRINERKLYPAFDEDLKPMTDKLARARPLQGRMQQGGLVLPPPETHPWVEMVVQELLRFPGGLFDDIVDALAWLVRMAPKIGVPVNKVARNSRLKSWRAELHKYLKTGASGDLTHMAA